MTSSEPEALDCADAIRSLTRREKLVVIVGAGVSTDSGIGTGPQIVRRLLTDDYGGLVANILGPRASETGFFTALGVYRHIAGEDHFKRVLRQAMKYDETSRLEIVSESYELLAHLLHHGTVTAIISLNFDEVLDRALELESESSDSSKRIVPIASLSEFAALRDEIRETGSVPRRKYLKPHGTIGKWLTIRITEERIRRFEDEKREVLRAYLEGATVLTLGWRLGDPDLLSLMLATREEKGPDVIVVRTASSRGAAFPRPWFRLVKAFAVDFLRRWVAAIEKGKATLARSGTKPAPVHQKSIGFLRHKIRSLCFAAPPPSRSLLPQSLEAQVALEIVMFALKARGQFEPHILFDCPRTARLVRKMTPPGTLASVLQRLEKGVITRGENQFREPLYSLSGTVEPAASTDLDELFRNIAKSTHDALLKNLSSWHARAGLRAATRAEQKQLIDDFTELTQAFDIDFDDNPRHYAPFAAPTRVRTKEELRGHTDRLLQRLGESGTKLCVSSYTGEWLLSRNPSSFLIGPPDTRIQLIVDDPSTTKGPYARVARLRILQVKARYDGWVHILTKSPKIHNMTALMAANGRFVEALYFRRESKTTQVTPVHLAKTSDLKVLKAIWGRMQDNAAPFE